MGLNFIALIKTNVGDQEKREYKPPSKVLSFNSPLRPYLEIVCLFLLGFNNGIN